MKDITFCVETKGLTEEDKLTLHKWCMLAGSSQWSEEAEFNDEYMFIGSDRDEETLASNSGADFNYNLIKYSEVQSFLGLLPKAPSEASPQPELLPNLSKCTTKEENSLQEVVQPLTDTPTTSPEETFLSLLSPKVSEVINKYGLVLEVSTSDKGEGTLCYKVQYPFLEEDFYIDTVEEFFELCGAFETICKFS